MKIIPYGEWERKEHCTFYNSVDIPFYSFTAPIDVTNVVDYCKKNQISFFYAMIYIAVTVLNKKEEFRYRLRGDEVVLQDALIPSFTDRMEGTRLHKICKCPLEGTLRAFEQKAKKKAREQIHFFPSEEEEGRDDYVYVTSMPWLAYTAATNTLGINKDDFIPRISWGKYERKDGKYGMPFSMHVNHRAIDGLHIGEYYEELQTYISTELMNLLEE